MPQPLEERIGKLEDRLDHLERALAGQRQREASERRRARWLRLILIVAVAIGYALYLQSVLSLF